MKAILFFLASLWLYANPTFATPFRDWQKIIDSYNQHLRCASTVATASPESPRDHAMRRVMDMTVTDNIFGNYFNSEMEHVLAEINKHTENDITERGVWASKELGRELSKDEVISVFIAHLIAFDEEGPNGGPVEFENYKKRQLVRKRQFLEESDFTKEEANTLIAKGVTGLFGNKVVILGDMSNMTWGEKQRYVDELNKNSLSAWDKFNGNKFTQHGKGIVKGNNKLHFHVVDDLKGKK